MKKLILSGIISVFSLALVSFSTGSHTTTYNVDSSKSSMQWVGKKVGGQHAGTVSIANGTVGINHGNPVGANIVIDMTSLACTDLEGKKASNLIGHLSSDDFFGVDKHPTATVVATKFVAIPNAKEGDPNYNVTANLTIKGVTNEITFPVAIVVKGEKMAIAAKMSFDRTKWGIKYGSGSVFDDLGDKAISDDVDINFMLIANSK